MHHHNPKKDTNKTNTLVLDQICSVFSILMPLTVLPQILKIYELQDASDLSLTTWVLYTIGVIPFLLYGIVHRLKPLITLNLLWLTMQTIMIVLIIIYG